MLLPLSSHGRSTFLKVALALGVLALGLACSAKEKDPRPPYGGGCEDGGCASDGDGGGVTPDGDDDDEGGGGAGGAGSAEANGSVVAFADTGFVTTSPVGDGLTVRGQPAGGATWVSADYDGQSFTLPGLARGSSTWLAADSSDIAQYYLTLSRHDTTKKKALAVPLVKTALVDQIYNVSAAVEAPSATEAQVLVQLVNSSGAGVAGVTVAVAGSSFVAYSSSNTWLIGLTETSEDGMAFVGNVPASKLPGSDVEISLTGNLVRKFSVVAAANAVSIVRVVAKP